MSSKKNKKEEYKERQKNLKLESVNKLRKLPTVEAGKPKKNNISGLTSFLLSIIFQALQNIKYFH